jgi:predicted RNA-binding Zn-ribbon protein involved in translation (DUF1610 family)
MQIKDNNEQFLFICQKCSTQMNVPIKDYVEFKCPNCKKEYFIYDNEVNSQIGA